MCGHAGAVGALRPLRRLPAPARRSRAGRRPRQAARAARHRRPGGAHRGLPDGPSGLAAPAAPGRRPRLSAHPEGRPPARRGGRPDLPHRPGRLGRPLRPDRVIEPPPAPAERQRLGANLAFLGYGTLDEQHLGGAPRRPTRSTRCSPRPASRYERFTRHPRRRRRRAPPALVRPGLGPGRDRPGVRRIRRRTSGRWWPRSTARSTDEEAYAARFRLVHAWRTFLFRDPQLPPALLPDALARRQRGRRSSTGTPPGCARPPTGTSTAAWTPSRDGRADPAVTAVEPSHRRQEACMTDPLLVDRTDGVVTLTLNRPDSLNSLDVDAQGGAARHARRRWRPTGPAGRSCWPAPAGPSASGRTCASTSRRWSRGGSDPLDTVRAHYNPIAQRLASLPKPVVAAVRGHGRRRRRLAGAAGRLPDRRAEHRVPDGVRQRRPGRRHRRLLVAAPARRPRQGDRAADAGRAGAGGRGATGWACSPGWSTTTSRCCRPPRSWPPGWPPARPWRTARSSGSSPIGDAGTLSDALAAEAQAQAICGATADHRNAATDAFVRQARSRSSRAASQCPCV